MIKVHESLESEIERFLDAEGFQSSEPPPNRPYNFVDNIFPCLKNDPEFPGVKLFHESTVGMEGTLVHKQICAHATAA
jgi:hypothetical protein